MPQKQRTLPENFDSAIGGKCQKLDTTSGNSDRFQAIPLRVCFVSGDLYA